MEIFFWGDFGDLTPPENLKSVRTMRVPPVRAVAKSRRSLEQPNRS